MATDSLVVFLNSLATRHHYSDLYKDTETHVNVLERTDRIIQSFLKLPSVHPLVTSQRGKSSARFKGVTFTIHLNRDDPPGVTTILVVVYLSTPSFVQLSVRRFSMVYGQYGSACCS